MENELWAAIIGAAIGFISTYLAAVVKLRQDLRAEYDKDLRERRIPEYVKLWKLTDLFPKYGRTNDPTAADVQQLTIALRDWYFQGAGMLLSKSSRDAYFGLQDALGGLPAPDNGRPLDDSIYESLRRKCSDLRTALVQDVGTRHGPVVSGAYENRLNIRKSHSGGLFSKGTALERIMESFRHGLFVQHEPNLLAADMFLRKR